MTAAPARVMRSLGKAPLPRRAPIRVLGSVAFWAITVVASVAALLPIRAEAMPPMLLPAERSLTFSGYDLASFREVDIDVAGGLEGTLRVVPVDLAVGEDGLREEVDFGSTELSLSGGLRVTPESFDYAPGDAVQRFGFTVVIDPAVVDRTRVAGLRFVLQPNEDGGEVTSVTVPLVAVRGPEDAAPTGPPPGRVELSGLDVHQDGAWTLVDRLLPDLPAVVGHAPAVAIAELSGDAVHVMSGATVDFSYDRVNVLSILPFVDDDPATPFTTTVEEGFFLPGERLGVDAASFSLFGGTAPREALPFLGIVRVTATARGAIDGVAQGEASETTTIVVFPWTEALFLLALGGALRKRRQLLLAKERERFVLEGPRVVRGGLSLVPELRPTFLRRLAPVPDPDEGPEVAEVDEGEAEEETSAGAGAGAAFEAFEEYDIRHEPVVDEPHMPVPWEDEAERERIAAEREREREAEREVEREVERDRVAAEALAAATSARRAAARARLVASVASAWIAVVGVGFAAARSARRGIASSIQGVVRSGSAIGVAIGRASDAVGAGSAAAVGAVSAWRRTRGRDLRIRTLGYLRAVRRATGSGARALGGGMTAARGAGARAGLRTGGAVLRASRGLLRAVAGLLVAIGGALRSLVRGVGAASLAVAGAASRRWRGSRSWVRTYAPAVARWFAAWGRVLRRSVIASARALGRGVAATWHALDRGAEVGARGLSHTLVAVASGVARAALVATRALARGVAAAAAAIGRASVAVARGLAAGAARAWRGYRRWVRTDLPAIRRWVAAWGRVLRRAAIVALRATYRGVLASGRGLAVALRATANGSIVALRATARGSLIVLRSAATGASRGWRGYRRWARTHLPAIRRWFAARGRVLRRATIASARVVASLAVWFLRRLGDLVRGTAVGTRRLARWWVRSGAPGTARIARQVWRASRRGTARAAIGTARWFAGKRRQSVRGWARTKRWTRLTLRFIARVARATWAGPLRWSLILIVKSGERLLRWLDRRNDDLPLD